MSHINSPSSSDRASNRASQIARRALSCTLSNVQYCSSAPPFLFLSASRHFARRSLSPLFSFVCFIYIRMNSSALYLIQFLYSLSSQHIDRS
jgi:hypothetical protein